MKFKPVLTLMLSISMLLVACPQGSTMTTPGPLSLYEKGNAILKSYNGSASQIHEADNYFKQIISRYPESPFGYLGMSQTSIIKAYLYGTHYDMPRVKDEALPLAVKAMEQGPTIRAVHDNYEVIERIFAQYRDNQEIARQYLVSYPDSPETYYFLGNFVRDLGEYEKAIDYYKTALDLEPADGLRFKVLKRLALIYLDIYDKPEKAMPYYEEALTIWDDDPVINEYAGIAYLKMHQYRLAIEKFTKSLRVMESQAPESYLLEAKGYLSETEGKMGEAIRFLEKATESGLENSTLHFRLGNLYFAKAEYKSAYDHFKRVIDLTPGNPSAYYFAGRSAYSLGEADAAFDYFRKCLQLDASGQEAEWIRKNYPELSQK